MALGLDVKNSNPKDVIGSDKLPLHLWPETATALGCLGLLDGALKYGRSNFRAIGVRASIYVDAAKRHINKWFEGEDVDPDSGLPHLAHALACLAILVDADAAGELNDDRNYPGGYLALVDKLTPEVARLKQKYADRKAPQHFTIASDPTLKSEPYYENGPTQQPAEKPASTLSAPGSFIVCNAHGRYCQPVCGLCVKQGHCLYPL